MNFVNITGFEGGAANGSERFALRRLGEEKLVGKGRR